MNGWELDTTIVGMFGDGNNFCLSSCVLLVLTVWLCSVSRNDLAVNRSWVCIRVTSLPGSDSKQVVHTSVSVTNFASSIIWVVKVK